MPRAARLLIAVLLAVAALPAAARASTVTAGLTSIRFDAAPGETNTAVIARQAPGVYFVGDLSGPPPTPSGLCSATPASGSLPAGALCAVPGVTSLTANLGDRDDTGVIGDRAGGPAGAVNGGTGDDTLVGGQENDVFRGDAGTDRV